VAVLTTSRADFGIYTPVLAEMRRSRRLIPRLLVSGTHVESRFGRTESEILDQGFRVFRRFRCLSMDMAGSMARMTDAIGRILRSWKPDILLVLGDRFEMFAGALGAVPFHVPIAHLHGGEITEGALDDSFRHALTKLAHLHFTATPEAARRIRQMGEEPWRIVVSGTPALDRLRSFRPISLALPDEYLLVTYHPVTREPGREAIGAQALIDALRGIGLPCVFTSPNADPGHEAIRSRVQRYCEKTDPQSRFIDSAGADTYFTLMSRAQAMVGNSSSGLIEAPSFRLPVVNVGTRQSGRLRARNVIDCREDPADIARAVRRALSPQFRRSLRHLHNPYGDGRAARRIVRRLASVPLGQRLLRKRFVDQ
jgi:UDP-hydrolysing UDP-N-acetyl-D-glucosamine 2-epimerase